MSELLREIEDDIRQEKLDRLWQRFGKFMVLASVAVILVTIAIVAEQDHRRSQAMAQTDRFIAAVAELNAGHTKEAIADFTALADDSRSPYYGLAMLRKAQAQAAAGDKEGAARTYEALAAHDGTFGGLAAMQATADAGSVITPDKNSPFYYSQSEWKGWQLLRAGKKDAALAQFASLRDDIEAPYSLRQRMEGVVSAMSGDSNDQPTKARK